MADIHDIQTFDFRPDEAVFYDTNIWVAINGLASFTGDGAPYSAAHKTILTLGIPIFTEQTVLQEFANLQERDALAIVRKTRLGLSNKLGPKEIKAFRRSNPNEWNEVATNVTDALNQILRQSQRLQVDESLLHEAIKFYETTAIGLNDAFIARLCQTNN